MVKIDDNIFERVYDVVQTIPEGKVMSYKQIAVCIGFPKSARIIGYVMSRTPREMDLPAHRVVKSNGDLAPEHVFGGYNTQKIMLIEEGVGFLKSGRVDMRKYSL